jgi:hypothetical protein
MQDSDDYFGDDFELDATALAIIDAEETKYVATQNSARPAPSGNSPPPKRQRVAQGYAPLTRIQRELSLDDYEDLPEITVERNGSYAIHGVRQAAAPAPQPIAAPTPTHHTRHTSATGSSARSHTLPRQAAAGSAVASTSVRQQASSSRPTPTRTISHPSGSQLFSRTSQTNGSHQSLLNRAQITAAPVPVSRTTETADDALHAELASLRARLDEASAPELVDHLSLTSKRSLAERTLKPRAPFVKLNKLDMPRKERSLSCAKGLRRHVNLLGLPSVSRFTLLSDSSRTCCRLSQVTCRERSC